DASILPNPERRTGGIRGFSSRAGSPAAIRSSYRIDYCRGRRRDYQGRTGAWFDSPLGAVSTGSEGAGVAGRHRSNVCPYGRDKPFRARSLAAEVGEDVVVRRAGTPGTRLK